MSARFVPIPNIPIHNLGLLHLNARHGPSLASSNLASVPLVVQLTRPCTGTLGNLPRRTRTCPSVSPVTLSPTQSSNTLVARGVLHPLCSRTPILTLPRTLQASLTLGVGSSISFTRWSLSPMLPKRPLLPSSRPLHTHSGGVWLNFDACFVAPICHSLDPLFLCLRGLITQT